MNDTQVGDYALKKGSLVMVHSRTLQLSPSTWGPDPLAFNPQHFQSLTLQEVPSKEEKDESRKKQQSMRPFGGGYNLCPGRHFAGNEILGGFAALIQMLEIDVIEGQGEIGVDLSKGKLGGLWPNRKVRVRMRRRR
jgi:cytochrome P450